MTQNNEWFYDLFIDDVKAILPKEGSGSGESGSADLGNLMEFLAGKTTYLYCPAMTEIVTESSFYLVRNSLVDIDLPNVTYVGERAFYGIPTARVSMQKVKLIDKYGFALCEVMKDIQAPLLEEVGFGAFDSCSDLTAIDFPNLKIIGERAFADCEHLRTVNLPNVTYVGKSAFTYSHGLTTVCLPSALNIDMGAFETINLLSFVDLAVATSIGRGAFFECPRLTTLILRSETMCDMNLSAVVDTGIISLEGMPTGTGFVYVPTALYEDYIAHFVPQAIALGAEVGMTLDEATATGMVQAILRKIEDYPEVCG